MPENQINHCSGILLRDPGGHIGHFAPLYLESLTGMCALGQEAAALAWEGQVGEKPPTPSTLKEWPSCPQVKSITRGEQVKPETAQSQRLPPGRCLLRLLH